jgi:hypothetical protein
MIPALALAMALAAPPAPAPADAEVRAHVEELLGAIDVRIPAERWKALGPSAATALAEVAVAEDRMPSRRAKALAALGAVDAPAAERISRALVDAPDAPPTVRETAVRTLGHVLSPAQLRSALVPVLRAGRPATLKAVAAETLARHGGKEACAEVMDQVALEPDAARPAFERAAATCAGNR